MIMEMRKIYCEEDVENMKLEEVKELCGFIESNEEKIGLGTKLSWTVRCLEKGSTTNFKSQENAEIYANTEMIKGMLLKKKEEKEERIQQAEQDIKKEQNGEDLCIDIDKVTQYKIQEFRDTGTDPKTIVISKDLLERMYAKIIEKKKNIKLDSCAAYMKNYTVFGLDVVATTKKNVIEVF